MEKPMNHYQIIGENSIEIVVEMGLGSSISEWLPIAKQLKEKGTVLLYERAGINHSKSSTNPRTPQNIARELMEFLQYLEEVEHVSVAKQLQLLAHSQGGIYAMQFTMMYPERVKKIILLDPLSPLDSQFTKQLSVKEYKKSGVDKTANLRAMKMMSQWHLDGVVRKMMHKAPPFYYYDRFTKEETKDILDAYTNRCHLDTCLLEYQEAHVEENLSGLLKKETFPNVPLLLITHNSELAITESMQFGNSSREFAEKVEAMWQEIMKVYLTYTPQAEWIMATKATHFIHLQQPELVLSHLDLT